jgi:peptide/nickel transport system permease protein
LTVYFIRRLTLLPLVLFGVSVIVFLLLYVVPGDPVIAIVGERAPQSVVDAVRQDLGLDRPLPAQYVHWISKVLKGDLGRSYLTGVRVADSIKKRFPTTVKLATTAFALSVVVGTTVGITSAVKQNTLTDQVVRSISLIGVSTPIIYFGLLLMYVFGVWLRWFPVSGVGDGSLRYFVLPAVALGLNTAAFKARLTRSCMLEVIRQDYIRTARSKGLSERVVIYKHALRNAMIPIVTNLALSLGALLTGSTLTETIFSLPGVGSLTLHGVYSRDMPLVMGCFLFQATIFVFANLAVDLAYAAVNPRIRFN